MTRTQGSFWKRDDLDSPLARSPGPELQTGPRRPLPLPQTRPPAGRARPPFTPDSSSGPTRAPWRGQRRGPGRGRALGGKAEGARGGGWAAPQPVSGLRFATDRLKSWTSGEVGGKGRGRWSRRGGAVPRGAEPGLSPPPLLVPESGR